MRRGLGPLGAVAVGFVWISLVGTGPASALELSGFWALETRLFIEGEGEAGQSGENLSLAFEPEVYHSWDDHRQSFQATLFGRLDSSDSQRSHADVRQLYWQYAMPSWEVSVGWKKVFWGVTESVHIVDVINQTDFVEDPDAEEKLGQPMVQLSLVRAWGTWDFFVLPGFRRRLFAGPQGRIRTLPVIDPDLTEFQSSRGDDHVDWAVRWSHSIGMFDLGLHHFNGTRRDPFLELTRNGRGEEVFKPIYGQIQQYGFDAQATTGPWLLKLEAIDLSGGREPYRRIVSGFERTFFDLAAKGLDLGVLAEYSNDDRKARPNTVFLGTRLTFNDAQSTDLLAGAIVSEEQGAVWSIEGSRRLGDSWKLNLRARAFVDIPPESLISGFLNDDYVEIELIRFF